MSFIRTRLPKKYRDCKWSITCQSIEFWNGHLCILSTFVCIEYRKLVRSPSCSWTAKPKREAYPPMKQCLQDGYHYLAWDDSWCVAGAIQHCHGDSFYLFVWVVRCQVIISIAQSGVRGWLPIGRMFAPYIQILYITLVLILVYI